MSKQQSDPTITEMPADAQQSQLKPNTSGDGQSKTNKKRRKHQRAKNDQGQEVGAQENTFPDDGVMSQLKMLDENDIVKTERKPDIYTITATQGRVKNSTSNGKVYLEMKGGFKAVDRATVSNSRLSTAMAKQVDDLQNTTTREKAVGIQSWFRRVATLSHGLLAGLALCQALTVWLLAPPHHTWQDFVEHYTYIAYPFYASSHFLLIVCVISVFDRYDVCKFQWSAIREQLGCGLELLTLLLYPLALGVALMGADKDIRLGQFHKTNSTAWWDDREYIEKQLDDWKYLVLVKCIAVIVGWLLLGMNPVWDQFYVRLKGSKES